MSWVHVHFTFQVPPLGHIPRILARMKASSSDAIPKACVEVVHILADSEVMRCISIIVYVLHRSIMIEKRFWCVFSSGVCAYDVQV